MNTPITQELSFEAILNDVQVMQNMCAQLMKSKHYQVMGEAGIFAIIQKAKALNINPLEALNGGLYYINGKVGMSTELMASLIRQAGHSISKDPKSDNSICILYGKRADNGDTWSTVFSEADAKKAGLWKNMFEKYLAVMLYNRAMSMLARQLFPDIIKGCGYDKDELMEIKPQISEENVIVQTEYIKPHEISVLETFISGNEELKKKVFDYAEVSSLEMIKSENYLKILKKLKTTIETERKKEKCEEIPEVSE